MRDSTPTDAGCWLDEYDGPRFWDRVSFHGGEPYREDPLVDQARVQGECWPWLGRDHQGEYGRFRLFGRWYQAHRVSFRDFGNPLPDELDIDHLCRNLPCVRPSHLESVTDSVNVLRGANAIRNRTHCRHGHELTPDNITERKRGERVVLACKTCLDASRRRTYARKTA